MLASVPVCLWCCSLREQFEDQGHWVSEPHVYSVEDFTMVGHFGIFVQRNSCRVLAGLCCLLMFVLALISCSLSTVVSLSAQRVEYTMFRQQICWHPQVYGLDSSWWRKGDDFWWINQLWHWILSLSLELVYAPLWSIPVSHKFHYDQVPVHVAGLFPTKIPRWYSWLLSVSLSVCYDVFSGFIPGS